VASRAVVEGVPGAALREPIIDRSLLAPIARYGGSALLVGLSSTLTLLVLRSILVQKLGIAQNGIYQVCVGVSGLTMPLILNSISATVWPEIASKRNDRDTIAAMSGAVRLGFLVVTGLCASLLVGAPIWVPLFYSHRFAGALDLLPFQFLGDYFRTGAWTFGIWLVPRERLRPWVLFDMIYGVVLLLGFLFMVDHVGLKSVVFAYVAAHVSHAVLHYLLARRALGFRLGRDNTILLSASFALLLGLTLVRPKDWIGVVVGGVAVLAWAAIVVKRQEWLALRQMAARVLGRSTASA
jgi:O-antigen/teichoic acid export membrane protein